MSEKRRNFKPVAEIAMYQARCTKSGIAYGIGDHLVCEKHEDHDFESAGI